MTPAPGFPTIRPFSGRQPGRRRAVLTRTRTAQAKRSYIDPFTPAEIRRLVAEFGSPLLIIDCQRVREQYRKLHKALPGRRPALRAQAAAASRRWSRPSSSWAGG